jgi:hypothetical protein
MRNLAEDLAPYYSTFAGAQMIPGVGHFDTTNELADMYSVLATDPEAGVTAALHTYAQENVLAAAYGAGEGPSTYAQIAGQMQHALETGAASAQRSMDAGDVYQANWEKAVEGAKYDTVRATASTIASLAGLKPVNYLIDLASPGLKTAVVGIVDPIAVVDPTEVTDAGNAVPSQTATTLMDSSITVEHIVNGLVTQDPSIVNDPDFAEFRDFNDNGDPYIAVENLNDQAEIIDLLYEQHAVDVESWYTNFNIGMHSGTIAVAGR